LFSTQAFAVNWTQNSTAVATYTFEESSGDLLDLSNANDGTLVNTVTQGAAGQRANAYDFGGGYVDAGDIAQIDGASSLSGVVWVSHDTTSDDDYIFAKSSGITDGLLFFRDNVASLSGRTDTYTIFLASSDGEGNRRVESATNASTGGGFIHVAFTWEGLSTTGLRLYVNGVEDANSPSTASNVGAIDSGDRILSIGASSGGTNNIDGKIDEAGIFESVLDATDINDIMDNGLVQAGAGVINLIINGTFVADQFYFN